MPDSRSGLSLTTSLFTPAAIPIALDMGYLPHTAPELKLALAENHFTHINSAYERSLDDVDRCKADVRADSERDRLTTARSIAVAAREHEAAALVCLTTAKQRLKEAKDRLCDQQEALDAAEDDLDEIRYDTIISLITLMTPLYHL